MLASRSRILSSSRVDRCLAAELSAISSQPSADCLSLNSAELVPESLHDAVADLVGLFVGQRLLARLQGEGVGQAALAIGQGEHVGEDDVDQEVAPSAGDDGAGLLSRDFGIESHAELAVDGREAADGLVTDAGSAVAR